MSKFLFSDVYPSVSNFNKSVHVISKVVDVLWFYALIQVILGISLDLKHTQFLNEKFRNRSYAEYQDNINTKYLQTFGFHQTWVWNIKITGSQIIVKSEIFTCEMKT